MVPADFCVNAVLVQTAVSATIFEPRLSIVHVDPSGCQRDFKQSDFFVEA